MRSRLSTAIGRIVRSVGRKPAETTGTAGSTGSTRTDGKLHFEYAPELDGEPGEVVWTWVPYEDDPTQGKDRPVVIVGRRGRKLVGVALTSKHHDGRADHEYLVGTGAWDREGRPSYAKLDRLLDIDPDAVRREGAILERKRFDGLIDACRRAHAHTRP